MARANASGGFWGSLNDRNALCEPEASLGECSSRRRFLSAGGGAWVVWLVGVASPKTYGEVGRVTIGAFFGRGEATSLAEDDWEDEEGNGGVLMCAWREGSVMEPLRWFCRYSRGARGESDCACPRPF
jgi:hypothetical protein